MIPCKTTVPAGTVIAEDMCRPAAASAAAWISGKKSEMIMPGKGHYQISIPTATAITITEKAKSIVESVNDIP